LPDSTEILYFYSYMVNKQETFTPPSEPGKIPCILIYDDDPEILFLCKTILTKKNYRVETLSHCENVINDIAAVNPDVVLMDLWIPEIGGEKAISLLKNNEQTKDIPVIIFSANAEIREICAKIKADGYLAKPFDITVLQNVVAKYVSKS
jgi:CheY-like chemotaxis protein